MMICLVFVAKAQMSVNNKYNLHKYSSIRKITSIDSNLKNRITVFNKKNNSVSIANTVKLSNNQLIQLLRDSLKMRIVLRFKNKLELT